MELARISKINEDDPTVLAANETLQVECDFIQSFPKLTSLHLYGIFTEFDISLLKDQLEELTLGHSRTNDDNFMISGYNKLKKLRLEDYSLCHVKKIENLDELVELELKVGGRFFQSHEFIGDWDFFETTFQILENLPKLKHFFSSDSRKSKLYVSFIDRCTLKDLPSLTNISLCGFTSDIELNNTPNIEVIESKGDDDFSILIPENDIFSNLHTLNIQSHARFYHYITGNLDKEAELGRISENIKFCSIGRAWDVSEISFLEKLEYLDTSKSSSCLKLLENCPRLEEACIRSVGEICIFSNLPYLRKLQIDDYSYGDNHNLNTIFMGIVKQLSRPDFSLEELKFLYNPGTHPSQIMIDSEFISTLKKLEMERRLALKMKRFGENVSFNFDGDDKHGIREIILEGFGKVLLHNFPELEKCTLVNCLNVKIKNCASLEELRIEGYVKRKKKDSKEISPSDCEVELLNLPQCRKMEFLKVGKVSAVNVRGIDCQFE